MLGKVEIVKEVKPKSIRAIGIVLAVVSVLSIISNVLGLFMIDHLTEGTTFFAEDPYFVQLFSYANLIAVVAIVLGLGFFVTGIFITRYKNWARLSAQGLTVSYLLYFWYLSVFISPDNPFDKGEFGIEQFIGSLIWSIPFILLIRYLNKGKIKCHFG